MTDAISSILSQIRAHETRMTPGASPLGGVSGLEGAGTGIGQTREADAPGFGQTLTRALDGVSQTQARSSGLQQAFEMGDPRADLARVMVAMQESQVAFRATVEVRNRLVQAYQDVMNMPV